MCLSGYPRVAIAAPRDSAKSTAISLAYILAQLCFKLKQHVLLLSSSERLAAELLGEIRIEFEENELLRETFKFRKFLKGDQTEIIGLFEDNNRFRVICKGSEQKMRGLKWERKRPDLVLADDMEEDEAVLNPDRRRKFREWFYGTVRPIVSSHGEVRVVGTILSLDSFLANLMPDEQYKSTIIEPLRTHTAGRPQNGWLSAVYRAHAQGFSPVLWEARETPASWQERYDEFKKQGLLEKYNQEYLNNPTDDSIAEFKTTYFRPLDPIKMPPDRPLRYYAGVDLAVSQARKADYTAIVVCGVDSQNRMEVVHVRRGHWDLPEVCTNLLEVQWRYHPELVAIEKGTLEKSVAPYLEEEMRKKGVYLNLMPLAPTADKLARCRPIQSRMKTGDVYFQPETSWYPEFFNELTTFPRGKHDDMVDAFSYIGLMLTHMVAPPTELELQEEELAREAAGFQNKLGGRNPTTGY